MNKIQTMENQLTKQGATPSTPLLNEQMQLTMKYLTKSEQEIVLADEGKQFCDFADNDFKELHKLLLKWAKFIGLKEVPDEEHIFMLVVFLKEHFPKFTLKSTTKAFNLAIAGKINVDARHFNQLSPIYISGIFNAYLEHKQKIHKKMVEQIARAKREEEEKTPLSKEEVRGEMIDGALGVFDMYKKTWENEGKKEIFPFGFLTYDFLTKERICNLTNDEKAKIVPIAQKIALDKQEQKLRGKRGMEKNIIQTAINEIQEHNTKKSDIVLNECKNVALSVFFQKLIENEEELESYFK
jgi:hypothetical protein